MPLLTRCLDFTDRVPVSPLRSYKETPVEINQEWSPLYETQFARRLSLLSTYRNLYDS